MFRYFSVAALIIFLIACNPSTLVQEKGGQNPLRYEVDLNNRKDDTFKVNLLVDDLTHYNAIYQFAATAPGTYQTMDIGRFVKSFKAYDAQNRPIACSQISTNQWRISKPEKTVLIQYEIKETWDTPVDSNRVYAMCGSSLENDHAVINGQTLFGYPQNMQQRPIEVTLSVPSHWQTATALNKLDKHRYLAKNYDHIVDSPILLGKLTSAKTVIEGSEIEIYAYSAQDLIKAEYILNSTRDILLAASDFTDGLPVDRYTFLFHFEGRKGGGAWEHNYSSFYVFPELPYDALNTRIQIPRIIAHEFFHIVTPLNLHSEIIENFNFVKPVPSKHLWLYEGTTEWAANILQMRAGLISPETYLKRISGKLSVSQRFPQTSLVELSKTCFTKEGQKQYYNIYQKGAVVAGLLDLKLLHLSNGQRGLREVINDLSDLYGPYKPFNEETFFEDFTANTYAEIEIFFEKYVKGTETLPIKEYYQNIGIMYHSLLTTEEFDTLAGLELSPNGDNFVLSKVDSLLLYSGLKKGDIVSAYNGQPLNKATIREQMAAIKSVPYGQEYTLTILRDNGSRDIILQKIIKRKEIAHAFEIDYDASEEQIRLRNAWLRNM